MEFTKKQKLAFGIVILITVLLVDGAICLFLDNHTKQEEKIKQATIMTEQQAINANFLQNQLELSKQNAEMLADFIKRSQIGQAQPVTNFTVQAQSLPQAAQQVTERINAKDPTLPPVALEKTDNTIVVPNLNKTPQVNYDVAVFKNNNYRNWEWGIGVGIHGGDKYIPIELQRNFSKDQALEVEYHAIGKQKGYEAKYKIKTDKLFGII